MHAVVVNVTLSDQEASEAETMLREQVVPRVSAAPGFVSAYWTRKGNSGLSMSIWQSEDAANAASEMVRSAAPSGVTVDSVEVREVVASA